VLFDGIDVSSAFRGRPVTRKKPLLWDYGRGEGYPRPGNPDDVSPNLAIRDSRWKLLLNDDSSRSELYDFSRSQSERENVGTSQPEVTDRLSQQLLKWRQSLPSLEDRA